MADPGTVTVVLGDLRESGEARLRSGSYASAEEVIRAGLRALDREEVEAALRRAVRDALDDPRPSIPAREVFSDLRAHYEARSRGTENGP